MPKWGNQDYKSAVFEQLSKGSDSKDQGDDDHFQHFENFSNGAPRSEVERGIGETFRPDKLSPEEAQQEFLKAAKNMKPQERAEIAQDFLEGLQERGLSTSWLKKMVGLGSDDPRQASPEDVARLSEYARANHPEVFRRVVADKPFFVRWLSKPLVAALVGVIAGKLLNRAYDS